MPKEVPGTISQTFRNIFPFLFAVFAAVIIDKMCIRDSQYYFRFVGAYVMMKPFIVLVRTHILQESFHVMA